tara:strand:- start:150 stop:1169 length:1020 start_codon:yes stop_codon:yes gene_type:complete
LPFGSFAQPNFHPDDRDWAHYVFILDKTGSMDGGKALKNNFKTPDIWKPTIDNLCKTIENLNNGNNIISVYLFAEKLESLNVNGNTVKQVRITDDIKNEIITQLKNEKPDGEYTHIYTSFKEVMNQLTENNNAVINEYIHSIHLFTDGKDNSDSLCEEVDPFAIFCELKKDNDYAEIISLNRSGLDDKILECIPTDCIKTSNVGAKPPQISYPIKPDRKVTFVNEKPVIQQWSQKIKNERLRNRRVSIKIIDGPYLEGQDKVDCYFIDSRGNKITEFRSLNHTLKLHVDKIKLKGNRKGIYKGAFTYEKVIYENETQKIVVETPTIYFDLKIPFVARIK